MWSGTEFIANVSLDRQVRVQNVSAVGCDTAEERFIFYVDSEIGIRPWLKQ